MKKLLMTAAITLVSLSAFAEEQQLVFKTSDGQTHAILANGLEIKFAEGNMTAVSATESLTLPLASLSSMEFGVATSVTSVDGEMEGSVTVTSVTGMTSLSYPSLRDAKNNLAPGIYVVRNESGVTTKLIIRK